MSVGNQKDAFEGIQQLPSDVFEHVNVAGLLKGTSNWARFHDPTIAH